MNVLKFGLGLCLIASIGTTALAQKGGDNSRNSLDWNGHYSTGKNMHLTLNEDRTYSLSMDGKTSSGKFVWNKAGTIITLPERNMRFKVGENHLTGTRYGTRLEKQNNVVEAAPTSADDLYGGKWMLIELNGKPVSAYSELAKKAFISFDAKEKRFDGYDGCNNFGGTFELPQGYARIKFGQAISTMRACIGGSGAAAAPLLMQAIRNADNYTINNGVLSLNKARMAPLARFQMIVK